MTHAELIKAPREGEADCESPMTNAELLRRNYELLTASALSGHVGDFDKMIELAYTRGVTAGTERALALFRKGAA